MKPLVALVMAAAFATIVVEHSRIHAVAHEAHEHQTEHCIFCSHTVVSGPASTSLPVPVAAVQVLVEITSLPLVRRARPAHLARGPPASMCA